MEITIEDYVGKQPFQKQGFPWTQKLLMFGSRICQADFIISICKMHLT